MTDTPDPRMSDELAMVNNSLRDEIAFVRSGLLMITVLQLPLWVGLVGVIFTR